MRENIKSVGLILAIAIASISLPTSVISMMSKPPSNDTETNNYYYNTTIIEQYNTTIIERYNTTIIEQYNTTIIEQYNTTIIEQYNTTIIEQYNTTIIEQYNTTIIEQYNNTIIIFNNNTEPEPIIDRSKIIEEYYFTLNETHPFYILGNYTLSPDERYFYDAIQVNTRTYSLPQLIVIEDVWFDIWNETDGEIGQFYSISGGNEIIWTPPYLANWIMIETTQEPNLILNWDWTVYDAVYTIDNTNETILDRSKPIESHHFWINTTNPYYILEYNMSENEIYQYDAIEYPPSKSHPTVKIIQKSWLQLWLDSDEEIGQFYYLSGGPTITWTPPFLDTWCVILTVDESYWANNWDYIIYDRINTIS